MDKFEEKMCALNLALQVRAELEYFGFKAIPADKQLVENAKIHTEQAIRRMLKEILNDADN